jgi:hypothetical protein
MAICSKFFQRDFYMRLPWEKRTFGRLFAKRDPQGFHDFFTRWVRELAESLQGKTVAIDGKTLRGSHDRANRSSAIHLVSAWASDIRLVLGQLKTADKSIEITAIPELIKTLDLQGAIVTPPSPKPSEKTGVSKTACTGAWIYLSEKTTAASAKTMARKIWESCAAWRPTC